MHVLVTCKNKDDSIKNKWARLSQHFSNYKSIQTHFIRTLHSNNEEDPIKTEGARVLTTFFPLQVYGDFSRRSMAATLQSLVRSVRISNSF